MSKVTAEVSVSDTGEVQVHIKGIKGEGCMVLVDHLAEHLGKVVSLEKTGEAYEREGEVRPQAHTEIA